MSLADLIPDADFRFHMRFDRAEVRQFFGSTPDHEELITQRQHWLRTAPGTYAALLPQGVPLLEEAAELAGKLISPPSAATSLARPSADAGTDGLQNCIRLGSIWEPDFLLLGRESDGTIRLWGGCVCFPSSWSLAEKIGHPIEVIHGVVPGLNAQIGGQIHTFLAKLKPGVAWQRTNWGLSRSPELNQHPDRGLPRLDASAMLDLVWFRVEHQALASLPRTGGILFGIRIAMHPLAEVKADPAARERLVRALSTMPEAVVQYKGLATARSAILRLLS